MAQENLPHRRGAMSQGPQGVASGRPSPGYFLLTLDTELAWGSFDQGIDPELLRGTRVAIRRLLALLDRYQIPATWAFVGHLLLDCCERTDGTTHPQVLRPRYSWFPGDWHRHDPATDLQRDPFWYGTDILGWVRSAEVRHEIGCHTFSHVIMDDPACTREVALSQLRACAVLHKKHGLPMRAFVFPRSRPAHLDVLRECGITSFRGPELSWTRRFRGQARRAAHLLHRLLALPPPTYSLAGRVGEGLVNLPASMLLLPFHGVRRFVPAYSRLLQASLGIRRAAERGEIFHLSAHPFTLPSSPRMLETLERIFELVAAQRDQSRIVTLTMSEMANIVRNDEPA